MAEIKEVVDVIIDRQTQAITQAGFGTLAILSPHLAWPERIRFYSDLAGVTAEFDSNSAEYLAAVAAFSQDLVPDRVAIARLGIEDLTYTVDSVPAGVTDTIRQRVTSAVEGKVYGVSPDTSYEALPGDTVDDIATGIVAAINASVTPPWSTLVATAVGSNGDYDVVHGTPLTSFYLGAFSGTQVGAVVTYDRTPLVVPQTGASILIQHDADPGISMWLQVNYQAADTTVDVATDLQAAAVALITGGEMVIGAVVGSGFSISHVPATDPTEAVYGTGDAIYTSVAATTIMSTGRTGVTVPLPGESVDVAWPKIVAESNDFYAVTTTMSDGAALPPGFFFEPLAALIEANKKLGVFSSNVADIINTTLAADTSTLAWELQDKSYDRSWVFYHANPVDFQDVAYMARMLPTAPGSNTWAYKTLKGVGSDTLTTNQSDNALAKNVTIYQTIGGVNVTRNGQVASGEYIDVMRGIDWLEARMEERVYAKVVSLAKIPFTDEGILIIVSEVQAQLNEAIDVGVLAATPAPGASGPRAADVSVADKANRFLPDVKFTGTLAGAIHKTVINGVVSL